MQTKQTPLMEQYWGIKAQHEDKVMLFRMGDFFEIFHRDAEVAAPILGITLTQRNKKDPDSAKMCGVPYHTIAGPIAKLLMAGHKVAICDQVEDPALAKGLVKRAVTRILTPGMVYDPDTLDQLSANYLCAYDDTVIAFADVTTGEALAYRVASGAAREEILQLLSPVEVVLSPEQVRTQSSALHSIFSGDASDPLTRLKGYIAQLQGPEVAQSLQEFVWRERRSTLRLSQTVLRHLEVFENSRGEKTGGLFMAVNRTQTAGGARLLKSWLAEPLLDLTEIQTRQDEIETWTKATPTLKTFRQTLARVGDVERRLGKVYSTTFNARDLSAIAQSILVGENLYALHPARPPRTAIQNLMELARKIDSYLRDELPFAVREGGLIKRGAVPALDELISLTEDTQKLLLELETREKQSTGISSLKVRYNSVFGFYIELTKTHAHKAPNHYRRKQTLTNAERYTTDELSALEEKILSARTRRDQMEHEIFLDLRQAVIAQSADLIHTARVWTRWDVLSALAWLALERGYCRPQFSPVGALHLEMCRHPVVETTVAGGFVPNSVRLEPGECLLLTGPNMAGKSTLMRQVALLAIMAQAGSFLPAQHAVLPRFEDIFTRIGASDFLSEGLSTFMVEMTETADILRAVGPRSLVIMDEIGRGTSTYDGLSLAQSILEFLLAQKKPYLLFATHYHELTALAQMYPSLRNAHMSVQEKGSQIQFLHTLQAGPANRSYGIHVAKLAGIPAAVTTRAKQILEGFEGQSGVQLALPMRESTTPPAPWLEDFKAANLAHMTPLEALNKLHEWQREASP